MRITRTENVTGTMDHELVEGINAMESAGWAVAQIIPTRLGWIVVYERDGQ